MAGEVRIREPLGERAAMLPLVLGGADTDLPLPGITGPGLSLEARGAQWFARPAPGAHAQLNGSALQAPTTLDDGDVIALGEAQVIVHPARAGIEVVHLAGNATVAPLRRESLPGDEVVAGVREIVASGAGAERVDAPPVAGARRAARWIVSGVVATLLLVIAVLLFALVPVPLQMQPGATHVHANGPFRWYAGDRVFLLPGRRALTFSHPGYRTQALTLDVTHALATAEPLAVTLAKLPDQFAVDTGGVAADLLVDGKPVAKVPGNAEIEAGAHELIVRAPHYVDYVAHLDVEGGGNPHDLKVQLQPSTGWLVLDTAPTGARISVDGMDEGNAPLRIPLEAGLRKLDLTAPARRAWHSEVAIVAGQTLDLGRIDLALPPPPLPPAPPAVAAATAATGPTDAASAATPVVAHPPQPARIASDLLGTLLLLPAGKYTEGSDRREQGRRANEVQREVTLTRAFYLADTEVTNAQFRAFKADHVSGIALDKSLDLDRQAVTNVGWSDAVEFCNWLSLREGLPAAYERRDGRWQLITPYNRGYRLPTEAEWEYAARYVDGQRWQRYAWGDALPPPAGAENLGGEESLPVKPGPDVRLANSLPGYRDQHAVVAPVASYAPSAKGFHDLGGNVSEWMHDVYVSQPDNLPVSDPMGAATDGAHAIRGPNWRTATIAELRLAWRDRAIAPASTLGFRVARFAEDSP